MCGFHLPMTNAFWDSQNVFFRSDGADCLWARSVPLTASDANAYSFAGASSYYALEAGNKAVYQYPYAGINPTSLVYGGSTATSGVTDSSAGTMTLDKARITFTVGSLYNGRANVYAVASDTARLPDQTFELSPNASAGSSNANWKARRLPGDPSQQTIKSMKDAIVPRAVIGSNQICFTSTLRLVAPNWWQAGSNVALGDTTYSVAEAQNGVYPQANPFMGAAMTGGFLVVEAIGSDISIGFSAELVHHFEYQTLLGTSPLDAQLRATLLDSRAHYACNAPSLRIAQQAKIGTVVDHGASGSKDRPTGSSAVILAPPGASGDSLAQKIKDGGNNMRTAGEAMGGAAVFARGAKDLWGELKGMFSSGGTSSVSPNYGTRGISYVEEIAEEAPEFLALM